MLQACSIQHHQLALLKLNTDVEISKKKRMATSLHSDVYPHLPMTLTLKINGVHPLIMVNLGQYPFDGQGFL